MTVLIILYSIIIFLIYYNILKEKQQEEQEEFRIYYIVCFDKYHLMLNLFNIENMGKPLNQYIFKIRKSSKKMYLEEIIDKNNLIIWSNRDNNKLPKSCLKFICENIKEKANFDHIDKIDKEPNGCYVYSNIYLALKQIRIFYKCNFIDLFFNYAKISEIPPSVLTNLIMKNSKGLND